MAAARENRIAALDGAIAEYEAQIPAELRGRNLKSLEMRLQSGTLSIADQNHHRIAMTAMRAVEILRDALNKPSMDVGIVLKSAETEFRAAMAKINRANLNHAIAGYLALIPQPCKDQEIADLEAAIKTGSLEIAEENRHRRAIAVHQAIESLKDARQDPDAEPASVLARVKAAYEATRAQVDRCCLHDEMASYRALIPQDLADREDLQALLSGGNLLVTELNRISKALAALHSIESLNEVLLALSDEGPLDAMAQTRAAFERVILDLDKKQEGYRKSTLESAVLRYRSLIPDELQGQSLSDLQRPLKNTNLEVSEQVRHRKAIAALRVVNQLQAELNSPSGSDPQTIIDRAKKTYDEANADANESQHDYRKSTFNRAILGYEAQLPDDLKQQALSEAETALEAGNLSARDQTRYRRGIAALRAIESLKMELESHSLGDPLAARDAVKATFEAEIAMADDYRRACYTSAIKDYAELIPPEFQQRSLKSLDMWIQSKTLSLPEEFRYRSAGALMRAIEALEGPLQDPAANAEEVIPNVRMAYEEAKKDIERTTFGAAIAKFQAQIPEDLQGRSLAELETLLQSGTLPAAEANRCRIATSALCAIENLKASRHKSEADAAKALRHTEAEYTRVKTSLGKASLSEAIAAYRNLLPDDWRQRDLQSMDRELMSGSLSMEDLYWNRLAAAALRAIECLTLALEKSEADVENMIPRVHADYEAAKVQIDNVALNRAAASYEAEIPGDLKDLSIQELEEVFRKESLPVPEENRRKRAIIAKQAVMALAAFRAQTNFNALAMIHRTQVEAHDAKRQVDRETLDRTFVCFQNLVPPDLAERTIEELEEAMTDRTLPLLTNLRYHRTLAALRAIERLKQKSETSDLEGAMAALADVHAAFDAAMAEADRKQLDYRKSTLKQTLSRYQMEVRADLRGKSIPDLEAQLLDLTLPVPDQTRYRQAIASLRAIDYLKMELERDSMYDPEPSIQAAQEEFDAAIAEASRIRHDFDVQILATAIVRFKIRIPTKCQDQTIEALQLQRAMSGNPVENNLYRQAIASLRAIESLEAEIRSRSPAPPQIIIERVQAAYDAELTQLSS